jgi:hypothetical protein
MARPRKTPVAGSGASGAAGSSRGGKKRSFHQELVLNRWVLGFFQGGTLAALKMRLGDDRFEGIDEDGQTKFFHELTRGLFDPNKVPEADLRRYDLNVVAHWQAITAQRNKLEGHELQMKYFQYLSLLFTELYLDWYFNHRQDLLDGLNEEMTRYRAETGAEPFRDFEADDLNKIAFWNATGSGKTLLLHVNIRQYLHYFQAGRSDHFPDKIILLTPNEGLSRQHLEELHLSGFGFSQFFNKAQSPARGTIEIIDINKLGDEMGDKTVAVDAFEGNNLVLVDEGHRGTGTAAGAWMARRDALVRGGFAFEYSATFGQAVAKGMTVAAAEEDIQKKRAKMLFNTTSLRSLDDGQKAQLALTAEDKRRARITATREIYAKCILFDYSYKFFYEDGYGKESLILNMNGDAYEQADNARKYFTACLLAYYQQLWLWSTHRDKLTDFNIEKPLWVFVGNTVSGEESDILEVVNFLADFLNNDAQIKTWLADLIADKAQILGRQGQQHLQRAIHAPDGLHGSGGRSVRRHPAARVQCPGPQRLKLVNIKSSKGELALRVGDAEPFGLINIGDDAGFFGMAEDADAFDSERDDFGGALFGTLNNKDSQLNVLIGSRKFTEGLEQLARVHHGSAEHGPGRRLADHPVVRTWGAPQGQGLLAQAHLAAGQTQGRASGQAGGAEHLRRARQLHGRVQGLPARGRHHAQRRSAGAGLPDKGQPAEGQAQDLGAEGWLQGQPETGLQAHALPVAVRNSHAVPGQDQATPCGA